MINSKKRINYSLDNVLVKDLGDNKDYGNFLNRLQNVIFCRHIANLRVRTNQHIQMVIDDAFCNLGCEINYRESVKI